jgi:6-phosphogluconate dehydrogenase
VVFDPDQAAVQKLVAEGATGAASLDEFVAKLQSPKTAWCMVPHGAITEQAIRDLGDRLGKGDAVIDGGNTYFKDDVRRARALRQRGIDYLDVGTSGGVWGLERGYCLMIGGPPSAFARLEPIFRALAPGRGEIAPVPGREGRASSASDGYLHCGPSGAGHFVKMIHNGIEYGLMQAYAEGFDILRNAGQESLPEGERYDLDLRDIAELWRRGSVVTSWLLDLTAAALAKSPGLDEYEGVVQDSGEGRWTIQAAIDADVPAPVITLALFERFHSRQPESFAAKVLAALRNQFGGHAVVKAE